MTATASVQEVASAADATTSTTAEMVSDAASGPSVDEVVRRYVSRQVWHPGLGILSGTPTVADVAVEGGVATLILHSGGHVSEQGAVLLPSVGRRVRVPVQDREVVTGAFLGLVGTTWQDGEQMLRGAVMTPGGVEVLTLPPQAWQVDAVAADDSEVELSVPVVLSALGESVTKAARDAVLRERWLAETTSSAHEYADDNDLCERFDEFMESVGLSGRSREQEVTVQVSFDCTVDTPHGQDPEDHVTQEQVRAALAEVLERVSRGYVLDYEVAEKVY